MTPVGLEPTPFRNGALSHRLRPLGQSVLICDQILTWMSAIPIDYVICTHTKNILDFSGQAPTRLRPWPVWLFTFAAQAPAISGFSRCSVASAKAKSALALCSKSSPVDAMKCYMQMARTPGKYLFLPLPSCSVGAAAAFSQGQKCLPTWQQV